MIYFFVGVAVGVTTTITVLVGGHVFTEVSIDEIAANPDVRQVYQGEGDA